MSDNTTPLPSAGVSSIVEPVAHAQGLAASALLGQESAPFHISSSVSSEIKRLIVEVVEQEVSVDDIADDTSLTSLNVHSLRLIRLVLVIESTFGVTFPEDAISLANFRTVEDIQRTISQVQRRDSDS